MKLKKLEETKLSLIVSTEKFFYENLPNFTPSLTAPSLQNPDGKQK